MALLTFEDFEPGWTREYGDYPVTREEIVAFARDYDPQPFHLDDEAGRRSLLGGLAASGWHTLAMASRMHCDGFILNSTCLGSPGIDELKWLKPVYPGDRLHARTEVLAGRTSKSRPGMGLVSFAHSVMNAAGDLVMTLRSTIMFARRGETVPGRHESTGPQSPPIEAAENVRPEDAPAFDYFEDIALGRRLDLGTHRFGSDEIVRFAKAYDPLPFHVDEAAALGSAYRGLVAPGWLTAANFMRRLVDTREGMEKEAIGRHQPIAALGPSPGFTDLHWLAPVYADDVIRYDATLIDKRATSRPGWGITFSHNTGVNQNGFRVFEFRSAQFWPKRG